MTSANTGGVYGSMWFGTEIRRKRKEYKLTMSPFTPNVACPSLYNTNLSLFQVLPL